MKSTKTAISTKNRMDSGFDRPPISESWVSTNLKNRMDRGFTFLAPKNHNTLKNRMDKQDPHG